MKTVVPDVHLVTALGVDLVARLPTLQHWTRGVSLCFASVLHEGGCRLSPRCSLAACEDHDVSC